MGAWPVVIGAVLTLSILIAPLNSKNTRFIVASKNNSCYEECPEEARKMMKELNQCNLGCMRQAKPLAAMSETDFQDMMADASDSCLVGDICYSLEQCKALKSMCICKEDPQQAEGRRRKRDLFSEVYLQPDVRRWPIPIPYAITPSFNPADMTLIRQTVADIEANTCIRFTEGTFNTAFNGMVFRNDQSGCFSSLGKVTNSQQTVHIQTPGCNSFVTIAHEIGHALGLIHEQQRRDRDQFVTIFFENLEFEDDASQFIRDPFSSVTTEYDFGSMMQYPKPDFARFGLLSEDAVDPAFSAMIGQESEVSFLDYFILNQFYCADSCAGNTLNCQNGGYPDPNNCAQCKCPPQYRGADPECNDLTTFDVSMCEIPQLRTLTTASPTTTISLQNFLDGPFTCVWRVTGQPGSSLVIDASSFDVKSDDGDCDFGWLELSDGSKPYSVDPRYCDTNGPDNVVIDSTIVNIAFSAFPSFNPFVPSPGFVLTVSLGTCVQATCAANAECDTVAGVPQCVCMTGFTGDGTTSCENIDECSTSPCGTNEDCMDTFGSFTCSCSSGFVGSAGSCVAPSNPEFSLELETVHRNLRRQIGARDMVDMTFNELLRSRIETENAACDDFNFPDGAAGWGRVYRSSNPAATLADFGNLTAIFVDAFTQTTYNPSTNDCIDGDCLIYRDSFFNSFINFACGTVLCGSDTQLYMNIFSGSGSLLLLMCSYQPFLDSSAQLYTLGDPCTLCPLGFDGCREGLCVEEPTTTPPATTTPEPVPTTTPPAPTTPEEVPTTQPPVPTTPEEVPTTTPPAPTTPEEVPTTQPPVPTTPEEVPTTQPPVPTTPEEVPTTQPPVPTTPEEVPTTQPPAPTTPEEVPTTQPPVPTTPEEVSTTQPPVPTTPEEVPTTQPPVPTTPGEVPTTQPPVPTTPEEPTTTTPPTTTTTPTTTTSSTASPGQNTFLFLQAVNADPDFASAASSLIMLLTDEINEFCATNASVCCQNTTVEDNPDANFVTEDDIEVSILNEDSSTVTYSITATGNENNTLCPAGSGPIPIPGDLLIALLNSNVDVINAALQDCCNATVTLVSPTLPPPPFSPSPPSTGPSLGLIVGLSIGGATVVLLVVVGFLVGCLPRASTRIAGNAIFPQVQQQQLVGQMFVQRPIQFQAQRQALTMRRNPMINSSPSPKTFSWVTQDI